MKFAHLGDCHIGSWRDQKLRSTGINAFMKAIDLCIEKKVDFILISGDLFNTSLPSFDGLRESVRKFRQLKDSGIPVYLIAGSHDFSPSGKTMIDVLESAGLVHNVMKGDIENGKLRLKFTVDKKTGAKITGILGRKGCLERKDYEELITENLEQEEGYKIFIFHSAIDELKSAEMEKIDSQPLSLLPRGFDYYAGGHVHERAEFSDEGYKSIVYPGPLFPTNFREIEKLGNGGFYIVNDGNAIFNPIQIHNVFSICIDGNGKSVEQIESEIIRHIKNKEFNNTIVTIRVKGELMSGKPSEINFKNIFEMLYEKSAFFVMKSTSLASSKEFEAVEMETKNVDDVEDKIIKEHVGQIKCGMAAEEEAEMTKRLMVEFNKEKEDGERVADFENRVIEEVKKVLNLDGLFEN